MILNSVELFGFQALNCWKFPGFPRVICTFHFGFQNCSGHCLFLVPFIKSLEIVGIFQ